MGAVHLYKICVKQCLTKQTRHAATLSIKIYIGGVDAQLHSFRTSALHGASCQLHVYASHWLRWTSELVKMLWKREKSLTQARNQSTSCRCSV